MSFFCLEGRIYINTLLNPLPVLFILLKISITSSRCIGGSAPGDTLVHTLVHDKYSPARCGSRKKSDRKVKQLVLNYGLLQVALFTVRQYNVLYLNVSGSAT